MPDSPFELMYRRPGNSRYENITEVLDDILIRLQELEKSVEKLHQQDDSPVWRTK